MSGVSSMAAFCEVMPALTLPCLALPAVARAQNPGAEAALPGAALP